MANRLIGLYGGTFDPIHRGHVDLAEKVLAVEGLDEIWLIPSFIPPHRTLPGASPEQRLEMCRLALLGRPAMQVKDIEILRAGRSYSIDTIRSLKYQYTNHDFLFIIGIDAVLELMTWKSPLELVQECKLLVIARPGFSREQFANFINSTPMKNYSSRFSYINISTLDISSTEIRAKLPGHFDVSADLDTKVLEYINKEELYRY